MLALVVLAFAHWLFTLPLLALAAFMAFFFRDPERHPPDEPGIIVAPADGRITLIKQGGAENEISIFLSPFDVHINRAPIAGKITDIAYRKGKFLMATSAEASSLNERNTLTIQV